MKKQSVNYRRTRRRKLKVPPLLYASFVVLSLLVVLGIFQSSGIIHLIPINQKQNEIKTIGKPTPKPSSNSSSSSLSPNKSPSSGNNLSPGGYQNTNGETVTTTSPNQWIISESGNIILKQPLANSILQSGTVISGSSKVSQVSFRLIDNQVGVIDQGSFNALQQ